uniref:DEAD/H (Asp-Glu-Ala-Asp/His) box helicase 11 n=1 Tax=Eptatretus burgeri TaxID=7764 RepID=A0A8C4QHC2_EPTBU
MFPFPFPPYGIQREFMQVLYRVLEEEKVGIFESPTGTGKSLSLICGALTWLHDFEERKKQEDSKLLATLVEKRRKDNNGATEAEVKEVSTKPGAEPDWIMVQLREKEEKEKLQHIEDETAKLMAISKGVVSANAITNDGKCASSIDDDDDDLTLIINLIQIYYCSRTHSQLSQFIHEVQRSPFGNNVRLVVLASRQNLCVNEDVRRLGSLQMINDACLELQKGRKESKGDKQKNSRVCCPFRRPAALRVLQAETLAQIRDVEETCTRGRELSACPYYTSRSAVPAAQLVVLPYQSLLHGPTRRAARLSLRGQVVIVDEAHNLMDTIMAIHSSEINGAQVCMKNHSYFICRLKAKNIMYITQLIFVLSCFIRHPLLHAAAAHSSCLSSAGTVACSSLQFMMLNPAVHFADIVQDCRSLIIAGGTMQPIDDLKQQLLLASGVKTERIVEFSCGTIIFFEMDEAGRAIANISTVVPGGLVCFFPSYNYLRLMHARWQSSGLLARLAARKTVFEEPKKASLVDKVLNDYSRCIQICVATRATMTGAILLSVVGGKMSEGINFSDNLARCVVMVGMPYPNITSPELKEKMKYLDKRLVRLSAGSLLCDNLSIRHSGDFASVVLMDVRYSRPSIRQWLPAWIGAQTQIYPNFGPAVAALRRVSCAFGEEKCVQC